MLPSFAHPLWHACADLANIKRLSALLESNLTLMTGDAVAAINLIAEELITIGSCREFNKLYENVRTPMCENLSVSMDAFWIACFLAGMAWIPYFWVLLRNGKIVMLKNGLGERMHIKKVKKGGGTDKIAPAPGMLTGSWLVCGGPLALAPPQPTCRARRGPVMCIVMVADSCVVLHSWW